MEWIEHESNLRKVDTLWIGEMINSFHERKWVSARSREILIKFKIAYVKYRNARWL